MEIAAFLGVSVLVIVTPGQDTALTIRSSLVGGRRAGIFTALGVSAGKAVWALATSLGIAALILAFEPALIVLKMAGAAVLVYLGLQALLDAVRGRRTGDREVGGALNASSAFRHGVVSNLGNPKMALFFTSLLPQFGGRSARCSAPRSSRSGSALRRRVAER
ncbi:MAG: LysE family translocator [Actinobacteria bacterium]|nr:LysE family translocator [Actinomycetota bacterium]